MAARRKAFSFYPCNWLKDPDLRRCSVAARGVWIDLLCLMFECESPGVLACEGKPWPREDLIQAIGADAEMVGPCIDELEAKGLLHRNAAGAFCCLRMVREEKARALRRQSAQKRRQSEGQTASAPTPGQQASPGRAETIEKPRPSRDLVMLVDEDAGQRHQIREQIGRMNGSARAKHGEPTLDSPASEVFR